VALLFVKVARNNAVEIVFMNGNDPSDACEAKAYPTIGVRASERPLRQGIQNVALLRQQSK
jgi:hypothetical protein